MIIDFSAHIIPRHVGKILIKKSYYGPIEEGKEYTFTYPLENDDPQYRLVIMEKFGVDMQLLSPTAPMLLGFDDEVSEIARMTNDYIGDICNKYPERFMGCALISLLDVESALEELDRCAGELGFRCVTISTNQNGKGLDSEEYHPFYERVIKYDVPIFLHPTNWESYPLVDLYKGWMALPIFGWPFDTTQAVWRLIFGAVLDKFPALKIVTHHLGGMLPYYSRRAITVAESCSPLKRKLSRPLESYFKQIYGDTALNGGPLQSLICGYAFFGPERMLFGSDYPFGPPEIFIAENIAGIKAMPIPNEEKGKILGKNAAKLLKLKH
ncbi:MAG: amidohydrolase family protein [Candidatus Bathyarchaeia archaeon]